MVSRRPSDLPESAEIHRVGQVAAGTHADNLRHAYLRAHFMNALLTDPRLIKLFDRWGTQTGLYRAADRVARAADAVAQATKVAHWMHPMQLDDDEADRAAPLVQRFEAAAEQFWSMLQPDRRPPLRPSPSAFVRDTLKLRWSWLAYEVVDSFFRHVSARAFGARLVRSFTVVYQSPPVPRLAWQVRFATTEGETVTAARARLLSTAADAWRACGDALRAMERAERTALGRQSKKDTRYLQHWAEWFYRAEVKEPADTISALAREYRPHTSTRQRTRFRGGA